MRLAITLLWDSGGAAVSDWIREMKAEDERSAQSQKHDERTRLLKADMVRARVPQFWQTLVDQLEAQCNLLNRTFPNDTHRQCEFTRRSDGGVDLIGHTQVRNVLRLRLLTDSSGIQQELHSGESERSTARTILGFSIDTNGTLYLSGIRGNVTDEAYGAELLIRRVIADY